MIYFFAVFLPLLLSRRGLHGSAKSDGETPALKKIRYPLLISKAVVIFIVNKMIE
jgi:hypothetical protein